MARIRTAHPTMDLRTVATWSGRPAPITGLSGRLFHPVAVYRFFDVSGILLYIGQSVNPSDRFRQHRRSSPWWNAIDIVVVEWCPDEYVALSTEVAAIKTERPLFNKRSAVAA